MIVTVKNKGRCVFADKAYKKDEVIEVCEYITIPQNQIEVLKKTIINDYWFGKDGANGDALLLLGNGSLYNHSKEPSIITVMQDKLIGFIAARDIVAGEELCHDYWYTPHFQVESSLQIVGYKKAE